MRETAQAAIAGVIIAIFVIILLIIVIALSMQTTSPTQSYYDPTWFSNLPWSGTSPDSWCVAGETYSMILDNTEVTLTVIGPVTYNYQSLCKVRITTRDLSANLYTNQDATIWYITDDYETLLSSYQDYLNTYSPDTDYPDTSTYASCTPGTACGVSGVYDCSCSCFDADYIEDITGDGFCDEDYLEINLNCAAFTWDSGDCDAYWCTAGQGISVYALLASSSTATAQQAVLYDGYYLCQAQLPDGSIYLGTKNGRVWYLFDSQENLISSHEGGAVSTPPTTQTGSSGCADGSREAFTDKLNFPEIAGCAGSWTNPDLRATGSGTADSLCATGWSICLKGGGPLELSDKVSASECANAGDGKFIAASSHCTSYPSCSTTYPLECLDSGYCSEPICCGDDCGFGSCEDAIWEGETMIAVGTSHGCANSPSSAGLTGVLCCKDSSSSSTSTTTQNSGSALILEHGQFLDFTSGAIYDEDAILYQNCDLEVTPFAWQEGSGIGCVDCVGLRSCQNGLMISDLGSASLTVINNIGPSNILSSISESSWFNNPEAEVGHSYAVQTASGKTAAIYISNVDLADTDVTLEWMWLN